MKIPAHFPKWNPTTDGLEDPAQWVMDIERSRLPPDTVFPCLGQVWQALQDCQVPFHAFIPLPTPGVGITLSDLQALAGFGVAKLQQGERVRILEVGPKPITVSFRPLRYRELEATIVPAEIRRRPGYGNYTLHLKIAPTISDFCLPRPQVFFSEVFHLVEDAG